MAKVLKDKVYSFFNQTNNYLSAKYVIEIRKKIVYDYLKGKEFVNIIDLGCGNGEISIQFLNNNNKLTLVDISENMLIEAKQNIPERYTKNVNIKQSDIESLKPVDKTFDLIICTGLLAHVPNVDNALSLILDISEENSFIVMQNTNSSHFYTKFVNFYRIIIKLLNSKALEHNNIANKYIIEFFAKKGFKLVFRYNYITSFVFLSRVLSDKNKKFFLDSFFGSISNMKNQYFGNESILIFSH